MLSLRFFKLHDDVQLPTFSTGASACFDIRARIRGESVNCWSFSNAKHTVDAGYERFTLRSGERALIPTGLILDIPRGYSVRIHPRSGNAVKSGIALANGEGIIDADYHHQLYVPLINLTDEPFRINDGDRIAQGEMIRDLEYAMGWTTQQPGKTTEREGGFGSTGQS